MSHFKTSYQEFIQSSFSPLVSVMCSPLVDNICKKNNLSFTELVQPFCKLNTEATFRDPSGTTIVLKNFRINISDVNSRPPQPTMARKFLNESVSLHVNERTSVVDVGGLRLDVPVSVPWFDAWRDTFLLVQFPSDHEFTKHYLACILVVSSAEANPLDTLVQMGSQLQQMLTISPAKLPKWFSPTVLRYHVLLHDNTDGNTALAESIYETMKTTYGINSVFYLNINSQTATAIDSHLPDPWSRFLNRQVYSQDINEADLNHVEGQTVVEAAQEAGETTPTTPVIMHPLSPMTDNSFDKSVVDGPVNTRGTHGGCLTAEDLDKIREFITCFCLNCLIPHVEQQIHQLTDLISNKKGMSRSLLSATKRWFGTNKPGIPNTPQPTVTYTHDSTELQLRRLGDLCFMFGAYSLAFTAYHAAKRDFNADAAWLYYAGALEMAALSLLMQPTDPSRKALEYAEESIITYLNSCRMPQFATRATLWTAECLRGRGQSGEAARQLIRMTSEDSDLRSALLLEQASYCFLATPRPPMPRKYGFHLVLAGHRFSKAGQRRHSLRCYRQAFQVYEGKQWSLAEDHIQHTIGRQAVGLKLVVEAAEAFTQLLPRASRQSSTQQATFLREYISTQQQLNSETGELPMLPLPVVDNDSIQVLLGRPPPSPEEDNSIQMASGVSFDLHPDEAKRWARLEEQLVTAGASRTQPLVFRPTIELLNNNTNNENPSTTYIGETISVSVSLSNPLHINVTLLNLRLLWSFIPSSSGLCQENSVTEDSTVAVTQVMERLVIPADMSSKVILQVMPQQVGELRIMGLAYMLEGGESGGTGVRGRQLLLPRGRRLRSTKDSEVGDDTPLYAADNRLRLNVKQYASVLRVSFKGLRKDMLCGELTLVTVTCENCGNVDVTRLLVSCATPNIVSLGHPHPRSRSVREVPLPQPLAPGQSLQVPMQVRGHNVKGAFTVDLLFYYESSLNQPKPLYRLVRHSWPIQVRDSLQVSVSPTRSAISQDTEETLNLRVQTQNTSQAHDSVKSKVCVTCAALHSPHWELSQKGFHPSVLSLAPQELAHFLVKVRRKNKPESEISKLTLLEDSSFSPSPDFLPPLEEEATGESKETDSLLALQATLILLWKATVETRGGDSRVAVGQHHVTLRWVGETCWWPPATPTTTLPSTPAVLCVRISGEDEVKSDPLDTRQRLVTFSVTSQPTSPHHFASGRVCILPVDVVVRNCCDCELEVQVEATGNTASKKEYMYSTQSCHTFQWVGCTRRLLRLSPRLSSSIKMAVSVGAAGTYDLSSHLSVQARALSDTNFVPQTWRSEAILVVT